MQTLSAQSPGSIWGRSGDIRRQRSCVHFCQSAFRLDPFQINHGRLDVAVSHPGLKCPDVHPVTQVLGGKRVAELVQEEVVAVRAFRALVAVLRNALSTIQLRPVSDPLHDHVVLAVGIPTFVGKQELRRQGIACLFQSPQLLDES